MEKTGMCSAKRGENALDLCCTKKVGLGLTFLLIFFKRLIVNRLDYKELAFSV